MRWAGWISSYRGRRADTTPRSNPGRFAMHVTHDPAAPPAAEISFDQFLAVDIRVGTIVAVEPFPEARKPALKLVIDFGEGIGHKKSSAQITQNYEAGELIGRQVAS